MAENTWLVVGLGNPGAQYAGNRHNVGQMVLDELAARLGANFKTHKTPSRVAEAFLRPGGPKLVLAKPNTYMNTSGGPVSALLKFTSLGVDRLIVVHDELDIPFDTIKLKQGGGHGGHNGLRDIQKAVGSPDFTRVRVGIGRPPGRQDPADYVLKDFAGAERQALPNLLSDAADAVEAIVDAGLVAAQQRFHAPS
ncbi:aminoacyl-tRNA hydrolase [Agromyces intestinalis]|uniref:Peptidyl-tRNA hydrolase n=1 Tax=Agromyces intestinalis TaxID=2592652 RepID=A0A5C1YKW0_9MICO|nr:aminoacyl-tRNA hydrolase [Agromyces intestinalis]QEO15442.1 aminoacyl-tRNA hydrolase [Agromyces intestinalis]